MERGSVVEVDDALRGWVRRRVVDTSDSHIYICTANEYFSAQREGREPINIGFPRYAVRTPGPSVSPEQAETP